MNATATAERGMMTGAVVDVSAALPFRIQVDAEPGYETEPLAEALHVPLAQTIITILVNGLFTYMKGPHINVAEYLRLISDGVAIRGVMRDLQRDFVSRTDPHQIGLLHNWQMPDDDNLIFDTGGFSHKLKMRRFAEDHFVSFFDDEPYRLFIVRLKDEVRDI